MTKYLLYYCPHCKWALPENGSGVGLANECPACGRWGLHFAHTDDAAELRAFAVAEALRNCEWLNAPQL